MNELKIFDRREVLGEDFKIYGTPEDPMFLAKDVAKWIEHSDVSMMLRSIDGNEKATNKVGTPGGPQEMLFLTEDGLYEVLMQSRKPKAKEFKREVKAILKSIRRHGLYATPEAIEKIMTDPKTWIAILQTLDAERDQRMALETQIEQDKRFTNFGKAMDVSSGAMLIGEFAKVVCNSGISIGRTRLFRWLRDRGYLMKDNSPYQKYVDRGLFAVREYNIFTTKGDMVKTTTLVTGKGQRVLLEELEKIPNWEKAHDL